MISFIDMIGLAGVATILIAYFMLQAGKLPSTSLAYSLLNLLGAAAVFISLLFNWNLSAGIIEIFWILISFFGAFHALRRKR